jgi:hypothetical protein
MKTLFCGFNARRYQQVKGKISPQGARGWSQPFGLLFARGPRKGLVATEDRCCSPMQPGLQRKSFFAACGKKDWSGKPGFWREASKMRIYFLDSLTV